MRGSSECAVKHQPAPLCLRQSQPHQRRHTCHFCRRREAAEASWQTSGGAVVLLCPAGVYPARLRRLRTRPDEWRAWVLGEKGEFRWQLPRWIKNTSNINDSLHLAGFTSSWRWEASAPSGMPTLSDEAQGSRGVADRDHIKGKVRLLLYLVHRRLSAPFSPHRLHPLIRPVCVSFYAAF